MSLSLDIKRTFLSFAQGYFKTNPTRFQWDENPKTSKIFIGDSFSARIGTNEKYPAIILKKNPKRWGRTSIDQRQAMPGFGIDNTHKVRADLVVGSVTFNCLSTNGVEAEMLADVLFSALVGYKDEFRTNGIHQLMDIQQGEAQLIRQDNVARLFSVPVSVFYAAQETIVTSTAAYELQVYTDDFGNSITQSIVGLDDSERAYLMYTVSGVDVTFNSPPASGLTMYASYTDSITLQNVRHTLGTGDGETIVYTLQSIPYFGGEILSNVVYTTTVSGLW